MMKEPDLEEETLTAQAQGQNLTIIRRTLEDTTGVVTVTSPTGIETRVPLEQTAPGRFQALFEAPEMGLYRLASKGQSSVVGLGPTLPKEFENTIATALPLQPLITKTRGGVRAMTDALPGFRNIRPGRPAAGQNWLGLTPRNAFETNDITQVVLLPHWMVLLLIAGLITAGWLREGRR
jgi:hypothetical protein